MYSKRCVCRPVQPTDADKNSRLQHNFKRFDFLDGTQSKSRFGLALTSLGDINWDGFQGESW